MNNNQTLHLTPVAALRALAGAGELVAFNAGPDGVLYLVFELLPADRRFNGADGASFAKAQPELPQRYRVVTLRHGEPELDVVIDNEPFNIHDITPLGDDLLLVCGRARYHNPRDYDKNGRVYGRDGVLRREIWLGDGIQTVQASTRGEIWAAYFDEGVFGDRAGDLPTGARGLVAYGADGARQYEFDGGELAPVIDDCYALNVAAKDEVWCYYYSAFVLVRLLHHEIAGVWQVPVHGSNAFAVHQGHALFYGGYRQPDACRLLCLGAAGEALREARIELLDAQGEPLRAQRAVGRGGQLHLLCGGLLYTVDMETLL